MPQQAVVIDARDNVATAVADLPAGSMLTLTVEGQPVQLQALQTIPFGHKLALRDIPAGTAVIKYGERIGRATQEIPAGAHVHVHNVESERARGDLGIVMATEEAGR